MAILLISMEYDAESPVAGYRHLFFFQKDKQNGQPMDHKPPTTYNYRMRLVDGVDGSDFIAFSHSPRYC